MFCSTRLKDTEMCKGNNRSRKSKILLFDRVIYTNLWQNLKLGIMAAGTSEAFTSQIFAAANETNRSPAGIGKFSTQHENDFEGHTKIRKAFSSEPNLHVEGEKNMMCI